jgi:hypothetical protein
MQRCRRSTPPSVWSAIFGVYGKLWEVFVQCWLSCCAPVGVVLLVQLGETGFFHSGLWSAGVIIGCRRAVLTGQRRQLAKREQAKGCGATRRRAQRRGRNAVVAAGIFQSGRRGWVRRSKKMKDRGRARLVRPNPSRLTGVGSCPACARPANVCDPDTRCRQASAISRSDRLADL